MSLLHLENTPEPSIMVEKLYARIWKQLKPDGKAINVPVFYINCAKHTKHFLSLE